MYVKLPSDSFERIPGTSKDGFCSVLVSSFDTFGRLSFLDKILSLISWLIAARIPTST